MRWILAALTAVVACGGANPEPVVDDGADNTGGDDGTAGSGPGGAAQGGAAQGGGGSGGAPACAGLSDELDDAASLACWQRRHEVEQTVAQYSLLDIGETLAGHLSIEPTECGWYEDGDGPLLFKTLSGDFVVEIHVSVHDRNALSNAPSMQYNSAGLLARDPASATAPENWLMYNLGYQDTFVGTEHKTTVDGMSTLVLTAGTSSGRLRMCRVGSDFYMHRWLDDESDWTHEATHTRDDLPATVQVGMIANGWAPPPDLHARFDYIRFGSVAAMSDCTAELVER